MSLTWQQTENGYRANGFRIRRLGGHGRYHWRLEQRPSGTPSGGWSPVSYHASLRSARYRASQIASTRIRRIRVIARFAVGAGWLVGALAFALGTNQAARVIGTSICLGLAARFIIEALVILATSADGENERPKWHDRMTVKLVEMARSRRDPQPGSATIHALPPDLSDDGGRPAEPAYDHANPPHIC